MRTFTVALSSAKITVNMNTQIHCSSAFKRFANVSMAKIHEDRFEQGTKQSTIWAVKVLVVVVVLVAFAVGCVSVSHAAPPQHL